MPQLDIISYTLVLSVSLVLLSIVFIFVQFTSSLKYAYDEAYLIFKDFCALLENYIFSKFGCSLRGLKSYLVFLFLPFFLMISFILTQYVTVFAVLASFVYFVFVWFRRARLIKKCLNKVQDFYFSDLGFKGYIKRDCRSIILSMICLKRAVKQNGVFLGRINGFDRVFLSRPNERDELFVKYEGWKDAFNKNLQATEEFKSLGLGDKKRVLEETAYVFRGLLEHAQIALMADKDSAGPAFLFPLTTIEKNPIYLAKQQEELLLIIEGRLTRVFPELVPLFERWSVGNTDRAQGMVTGYSIFYDGEREHIVWTELKPKSFNERFLEKGSVDSINRSLEVYENSIKEILNSNREPTSGVKLIVKPTFGVLEDVI